MTQLFDETAMAGIEHVVLLMLENRSLDSLLGWLYEHDAPTHNIPPLGQGERAYEGLQGLDLNRYVNSSDIALRQDIDLSLHGVLAAGKWKNDVVVDQDDADWQRMSIRQHLGYHSSQPADEFKDSSDDELIGMAGAVIFLEASGTSTLAELQKQTTSYHRNTLIVATADIEMARRHSNDRQGITAEIQAKSTKDIVELATRGRAWVRLRIRPTKGANALNCPNFSPGESFAEVARQHYGVHPTPEERHAPPRMRGFVADYVHVLKEDRGCSDEQVIRYADQIMRSYTPAQLPVLNGLARHYAVSDMWFSSVPSQTNCNRAFAFCGTSNGMVDNGFLEEDGRAKSVEKLVGYKLGDDRVHAQTIFNALAQGDETSWKIFYRCGLIQENITKLIDVYRGQSGAAVALGVALPWYFAWIVAVELVAAIVLVANHITDSELSYLKELSDKSLRSAYSYRLFPELTKLSNSGSNFEPFEKFHEAARAGTLPNFTFIEPVWSISPQSTGSHLGVNVLYHLGDDYHPPCNLGGSEDLVARVYSSLISNTDAWNKTLLVITFDEPVGSFDHVPPPAAAPPWGGGGTSPVKLEHGFGFDRLGGRVPTLLISPLIEKGTVFRSTSGTPFDHTSLIATVLKWRKKGDKVAEFGERTRLAPTFENVITRTQPRTDARSVSFLDDMRKIGDPVRFFDRFCLGDETWRDEYGRTPGYLAPFKQALAEGAVWGGVLVERDSSLTEFFPTLTAQGAKASQFYCVNPQDRVDGRTMTRHSGNEPRQQTSCVKIVGLDTGLMSYNVLGVWKDSRDCYYSNDYVEGAEDEQEQWHIVRPDDDDDSPDDRSLRYGQRVLIESRYWPGYYLCPDGDYVKTSRHATAWKVWPVEATRQS